MALNKYLKYGLIGLGACAVVIPAIVVPVVLLTNNNNNESTNEQPGDVQKDDLFYLSDESRLPQNISHRTISLKFEDKDKLRKWGVLTGNENGFNTYSLSTDLTYKELIAKKDIQSTIQSCLVATTIDIKNSKTDNLELNDAEKEFIFKNIKVELEVSFKNLEGEYKIERRTDTLYWYLVELPSKANEYKLDDLVTRVNQGNATNKAYFTPYQMYIKISSQSNILKTKNKKNTYSLVWSTKTDSQEQSRPIKFEINRKVEFENRVIK